jgi:NAD(P)-dependent dehydrogenase (short-subunit alcohol dehydrogenase family)
VAEFAGKVVAITGAAGGIGQVLCRHFFDEGATVAALDKNPAVGDLARSLVVDGGRVESEVVDVSDTKAVPEAFGRLEAKLGPVDVLVNNAGFSGFPILETTSPDEWRMLVDGNLNSAYVCAHAVLKAMKARRGGVIVNIGSVNALLALGDPAYSAAKAGMISLTQALAIEYGRFGIRANIVLPGTVRTPVWDYRIEKNPEILDQLVKWYPLRRIVDPIDIARAVAFLASDSAAAITGAVLPVDCGLTAGNIQMTREITMTEM